MQIQHKFYLLFFSACFIFFGFAILPAEHSTTCREAYQRGLDEVKYFQTPRGNTLRYTLFESPLNEKKQTIFFVQGRATFLEFYEELIVPLLERGFDVWTYDLSGQGGSSRLIEAGKHDQQSVQYLQHIDSFDLYLEDMHSFILDVVFPKCKRKIVLGGYSTGGHLALRYLQRFSNIGFKSLFLISPLIYLNIPLPHCVLSNLFWSASWVMDLERYRPGTTHEDPIYHMKFSENPYTGSETAFQEMVDLCNQHRSLVMGGTSIGWTHAALKSVDQLWKREAIENISVPVFIATGGADEVVNVSYNEGFSNRLKSSVHLYYPEGRHELFRETDGIRTAWWKDFDEFHQSPEGDR